MSSCKFIRCNDSEITPKVVSEIVANNFYEFKNEVYIKENNEYVPYIVVTDDYNGNVLLMRKNPLLDKKAFNENTSDLNYYPNSDIDKFLSIEFFKNFSQEVQNIILDTSIEVTSYETLIYMDYPWKNEIINRKIFLLSAAEYGIKSQMTTAEGTEFKVLRDYLTEESEWLRSAYLWESYLCWQISSTNEGSEYENVHRSIRPVFTISPDVKVKINSELIAGESVYILECDS